MNYLKKDLLPIKTERLLIRFPEPEEAEKIVTYVVKNREHLEAWEPVRSEKYFTLDFWKKEIKKINSEFFFGQSVRLSIFLKDAPEVTIIGVCNFTNIIRAAFQACHLSYSIDQSYEGQGLMHEALKVAIDFVFKKFKMHRIMANYMPRNDRSGRLLKKLGFVTEGYAREYLKIAGKWEDHILTAKVNY